MINFLLGMVAGMLFALLCYGLGKFSKKRSRMKWVKCGPLTP